MKKKKSKTIKAIVDRHLEDKNDVIREEDMKKIKLGVEDEDPLELDEKRERKKNEISAQGIHGQTSSYDILDSEAD
ncbi:hypothetical protein [Ferruginibacter sp. HRS2-29]|uniref:hypothetical protein n=1 Tax=Ferruginibacter sp. HRS2-29 TaxID=2487334 RepID=UPI0020CE33E9|nr:hypothetical protein [Ferruginibacter sp. HRS2-29]MCP9751968.1 hypothetical protein [Ferruginibacter sp. HRS2-29]